MRAMTSAMQAAVVAENVRPVMLIAMDFSSGFVYVNSSPYSITYDGNEYIGIGDYGQMSAIEEGADMRAFGATFTLTGIPSDYIAIALDEDYQGRAVSVYYSLLDADHALIADPIMIWKGRMDTMEIESGETSIVSVSAESIMAPWDKPPNLRYNDATQQRLYSGDKSMEFEAQSEEKEIVWR